MAEGSASSRSAGRPPPSGRRGRRWERVVGAVALTVVGVLVALDWRRSPSGRSGASGRSLTRLPLTGQAEAASEGLRRLCFTCSDSDASRVVVTRGCTRVQLIESVRVQLVVVGETGAVQLARTTIDARRSAVAHGQVLAVLDSALSLEPADRTTVLEAAAGDADQSLELGWGSFVMRPGAAPESELRAAGWDRTPPGPSKTTLTGSVDALAAAAGNRGYACTTPQVQTIRSCSRSEGGHFFDLWMQGTDTYLTTLYLSVTATYRTQTPSHWVDEMAIVLTWLDPAQGRNLSSWLAGSANAPGADAYVDGLRISFFVRADEWTMETFGDVAAECGRTIDDIHRLRDLNRRG